MSTSTRIATRRASRIHHVVTGVPRWFSGMLATTECGTKNADVHENEAKRDDALLCKRCARVLGWDRSMTAAALPDSAFTVMPMPERFATGDEGRVERLAPRRAALIAERKRVEARLFEIDKELREMP